MDDGGAGGDGGFDGCECIWSHELATRRIINMIRQTQDYCTENECITDGQGGNVGATGGGGTDMGMLFIGFWFLLAVVLFFMRPRRTVPPGKDRDDAGPSFDPPPPTAS